MVVVWLTKGYDRHMTAPSSPTQDRTRRVILLAAIQVLGANRSAGIRHVADGADVARSTVHRYFPDRAALERGLDEFVEAEYDAVIAESRLDDGSGLEAILRFGSEIFDRLDVFGWWFLLQTEDVKEEAPALLAVAARGAADGSLDPTQPDWWVMDTLWSLLYSSHLALRAHRLTRGEVRDLFARSLRRAIAADGDGA